MTDRAKPDRRGSLAMRANTHACFKPPQQFIKINAVMMPGQTRLFLSMLGEKHPLCRYKRDTDPATPMNPMMARRRETVGAAKNEPQQ